MQPKYDVFRKHSKSTWNKTYGLFGSSDDFAKPGFATFNSNPLESFQARMGKKEVEKMEIALQKPPKAQACVM